MSIEGKVKSVNVSSEKGTAKRPVDRIEVHTQGVERDAHAGPWHRQVSLLAAEDIARFADSEGRAIGPGEFGENITTAGLDLSRVAVLDRFLAGEVELEVTQLGKSCHGAGCAIFREVGRCVMPDKGVFTRVVASGTVRPGDRIEHLARTLRMAVITLSDRAAAGVYEDRSGPRAEELLTSHFRESRWHVRIERTLLADDTSGLRAALEQAVADHVDVVFTVGSTGIGPRDIAPEVVESLCERTLPGIMEFIRVKYGHQIPSALLSRSVAGVVCTTQIYTLPGSVRAVEQYLAEILRTLEHAVLMIHGIDGH